MNKSELIDNIMFAIESNHPELKYEISQIIDRILQDTLPNEQVEKVVIKKIPYENDCTS